MTDKPIPFIETKAEAQWPSLHEWVKAKKSELRAKFRYAEDEEEKEAIRKELQSFKDREEAMRKTANRVRNLHLEGAKAGLIYLTSADPDDEDTQC